jgi:hypothetical protein
VRCDQVLTYERCGGIGHADAPGAARTLDEGDRELRVARGRGAEPARGHSVTRSAMAGRVESGLCWPLNVEPRGVMGLDDGEGLVGARHAARDRQVVGIGQGRVEGEHRLPGPPAAGHDVAMNRVVAVGCIVMTAGRLGAGDGPFAQASRVRDAGRRPRRPGSREDRSVRIVLSVLSSTPLGLRQPRSCTAKL